MDRWAPALHEGVLFDAHPDCVMVLAADGSVLEINAAGLRALGVESPGDVRGRPLHSLVVEDERAALHDLLVRAFRGESASLEFRVVTRQGEQRWLQTHAAPLRDPSGSVTTALAIARDVTERKRAEAALRLSEERHRVLSELVSDYAYVFRVTPDGELVAEWVTDSFTRTFGLTLPELRARGGWRALVLAEDLPRALAHVQNVLAGRSDVCDMRWRTCTGDVRYLRDHACPGFDEAGRRVVRVYGAAVDITERMRAEAALRESEERFRLLVDHAPEAVVLLDVETGRFVHANPAAEQLFGMSAAELARFGPAELSPDVQPDGQPSAAKARALIAAALAGDKPVFEWIHRDATGRDIPCEVRLLRLELGGRTIVRGSVLDISERKAVEARLRRLSRTHSMLSQINQLIVREKDPQTLLESACRIAVEVGGFGLAWVGLRQRDGALRVVAHAGATRDTVEVLRRFVEGEHPDCAFTFHALARGERSVCTDVAGDERARNWRDAALARGHLAMASLPLRAGSRTVGTFNLYARAAGFFDEEELRLLDELADDIAFALQAQEQERERQRAERALRELIRTVDGIVWEADADTLQFTFVSSHAERLLGYPVARWLSEPDFWARHIHPEDRDRAVTFCVAATRAGRDHQFEYRMLAADGRVVWLRDLVTVAKEDGRPVKLRGIMVDVTAARELEAALRASERRFRLLIENAPDMIHVIDDDGTLRFQSPSAQQTLGYREDERLGRSVFELVHPEDLARSRAALQEVVAHPGRSVKLECRFRHANGQWRFLEVVGRSLPEDASGGFVVLNSRDVTERRMLEEQLRQAQKLEAIGQLAGGVAHDFNNILGVIVMQAGLLGMEGELPPEVRTGLQEIAAAAERAANLTRQLLLFGRRQVMQLRDVDLNEVVTNLARMLQRIIGEDVRLQLHLSPVPLWTHADPGMLDQVLMNLAVYARDAMPEGGPLRIETMARTVDAALASERSDIAPGAYVGLRVQDQGCGIAPEHLSRIFEPFFTTKGPGKGTGLGLATVFGIVKQHGGWIDVQSQLGRGTTFDVYLPALRTSVASTEPTGRAVGGAPGGTETILLVEDDDAVRAVTRTVLERHGYRVLEAPDGPAAIERWRECRDEIALLLTDMVMPRGLSGRDLARRLRADQPNLKVMYLTGYSADVAGRDLVLEPGQNLLQKPFEAGALLNAVRRCLDA